MKEGGTGSRDISPAAQPHADGALLESSAPEDATKGPGEPLAPVGEAGSAGETSGESPGEQGAAVAGAEVAEEVEEVDELAPIRKELRAGLSEFGPTVNSANLAFLKLTLTVGAGSAGSEGWEGDLSSSLGS